MIFIRPLENQICRQAVSVHDRIHAVNGISGTPEEIMAAIRDSKDLAPRTWVCIGRGWGTTLPWAIDVCEAMRSHWNFVDFPISMAKKIHSYVKVFQRVPVNLHYDSAMERGVGNWLVSIKKWAMFRVEVWIYQRVTNANIGFITLSRR